MIVMKFGGSSLASPERVRRAGVLARIFGAVANRGIKARMVSQAASEINVAFLVREDEIAPAVRALHDLLLEPSAG